jgi:hypothetical protein
MRLLTAVSLLGAMSTGCLMAGNYHSAKTLSKGTSRFGATVSVTNYEAKDEETGDIDRITLPSLVPEFTYHIGVADNVEVGGRAALGSLAIEGDVKVRFLQSDKLHLAVAPAIGYQALVFASGVSGRFPLILTYELADSIDFTIAGFGGLSRYTPSDEDLDTSLFNGTGVVAGGAVGFDIHTETFHIRPAVEAAYWSFSYEIDGMSERSDFNTLSVLVHIAWVGGTEKKQLNRIEQKIDNLSTPPPPSPGAPPPPPVYPPPAEPPPPATP